MKRVKSGEGATDAGVSLPLNINTPPPPSGLTPRQVDTDKVHRAIDSFADSYPAAGDIIKSIGVEGLNVMVDRILLALHPRVINSAYPNLDSLYDLPFGTSIL